MKRVGSVGVRLDDVQWKLGKTELIIQPDPITAEERRRLEKQERRLEKEYRSLREKIVEWQHTQNQEARQRIIEEERNQGE